MGNLQAILPALAPMGIFILIFYFLIIRPQKKQERNVASMRSNISVGDEVITIGGIVGKVVKVKEDEVTIEVGADKIKIGFKKWALREVVNSKKVNEEIK